MKRLSFIILLIFMIALPVGCGHSNGSANKDNSSTDGKEPKSATGEVFAMDTYMTITCYGSNSEEAVAAAIDEINRLDKLLSVGDEESEVAKINQSGEGTLSEDTGLLLEKSLELYKKTDGAYDITIYPIMELWGFTGDKLYVPNEDELDEVLAACGSDKLIYDSDTKKLTLGTNQGIDFGGIAKGYTSSRIMEIFAEYDIDSGMVSLGGNVQLYGKKTDGSDWRCGIVDPFNPESPDTYGGILTISDKAIITSGAYERYYVDEKTGNVYHHIINPKTGFSADSGLVSVTIVSDDGTLADGLSTSLYIMGLDESIDYWRKYGDDFEMILITEDESVYITENLENCFSSDYDVEVIRRQ